jgi:nitrite reductase/ring-hydroxylating ferredoxin subunit
MAKRSEEHTELPIPNGWFAVAWSKDLVPGEVRPIHYFDEDLVLFRTRSGQPRVLDAYCSHLGAHLGETGRVVGETVRCPFHGWQYDGESGACVQIPYCDQIPAKARVRAWPVTEKNGMIFAWYHAEKSDPEWDVPLLPEIGHPEWSDPRTFEIELPAHVQDSHENNNDPTHFQFVHNAVEPPESRVSFSDDGRSMTVVGVSNHLAPGGTTIPITVTRRSWGLGLVGLTMGPEEDAMVLMFSSTTPINARRSLSRWLLTCPNGTVDVVGEEFIRGLTQGVLQDMPIWKNKVHRAKPVLCKADRTIAEYRQWVRQFYSHPA